MNFTNALKDIIQDISKNELATIYYVQGVDEKDKVNFKLESLSEINLAFTGKEEKYTISVDSMDIKEALSIDSIKSFYKVLNEIILSLSDYKYKEFLFYVPIESNLFKDIYMKSYLDMEIYLKSDFVNNANGTSWYCYSNETNIKNVFNDRREKLQEIIHFLEENEDYILFEKMNIGDFNFYNFKIYCYATIINIRYKLYENEMEFFVPRDTSIKDSITLNDDIPLTCIKLNEIIQEIIKSELIMTALNKEEIIQKTMNSLFSIDYFRMDEYDSCKLLDKCKNIMNLEWRAIISEIFKNVKKGCFDIKETYIENEIRNTKKTEISLEIRNKKYKITRYTNMYKNLIENFFTVTCLK